MRFAAESDAAAHLFSPELTDELTVTGPDAHHLARVRRLRSGELVTVADGNGTWRGYEVARAQRDGIDLTAAGPRTVEPRLRPALAVAFAVTKGSKPELVVRQLTELGVDRIHPIFSDRSVPRWDEHRAARAADRFRRVAREAAAQCRRATLPLVDEPAPLPALAGTRGLVVAHREGAPMGPAGDWTLVVGPEGGLTAGELAVLGDPPRLSVAPHVLRAETAAVAAAGVLSARRTTEPGHPAWPGPPPGGTL